ncbi:MAG: serine/threonine-protein kinase [Acidobacteriota bacterium]
MSEKRRRTVASPGNGTTNNFIDFSPGTIVNDRFRIEEDLGAGGFGKVYKALDTLLNKNVALKFLDPVIIKDEKKFLRVQREVNTAQKISDERVVKIFSLEYYEEIPFLVMEFVDGKSLKEIIVEKGLIPWEEFKPIFLNILGGVKALHDKEIIHRDLKPSNILITKDSSIKIIDFGLSKEFGDTEKTSSLGEIIGTPMYMSPEQIQGKELDFRSDIYQLGLVLYRAISGDFNYEENNSTLQQMLERLGDNSRKIFRLDNSVPSFLKFSIYKAVESDKSLRFGSTEEMARFLDKEKLNPVKPILIYIKKRKVLFSVFFLVILSMLISGFIYMKNSKVISDISFTDSKLVVKNPIGSKLFEKDYSPMTVLEALPIKIEGDFGELRGKKAKDNYFHKEEDVIAVFLTKKDLYRDIINLSLNSNKFSSNVRILNKNGKELVKQNFHRGDGIHSRALFSGWMNFVNIHKVDLNNDGDMEILFRVNNSLSMFPSDLCVINKKSFHIIFSRGQFQKTHFFKRKDNEMKLFVIGNNNPFAHMNFICEIPLLNVHSVNLPPVPDRRSRFNDYDYFYTIIPWESSIKVNEWSEKGRISLKSNVSSDIYIIRNDYSLDVISDGKTKHYKDIPLNVKKVIFHLSKSYVNKVIHHNYLKGESDINNAIEQNISNPLLQFLINYFSGDNKILQGKYEEGEKLLVKASSFFDENDDLLQRKAELYFLKGDNLKFEEAIKGEGNNIPNFFGLGVLGTELFVTYYYLSTGQFLKAEDVYKKISGIKKYLIHLTNIFRGNYRKSLEKIDELILYKMTPFTLAESRLVFARVVLLNSFFNSDPGNSFAEKMKLAEFYFSDIASNSFFDKNLVFVSRAYFEALKGHSRESKMAAVESIEKVLKESKGNLMSKLWLFYDAFIYGKTMELLRDKKEAIRGYKLCIKSNPYTDLAKRAEARIKSLSRNISLL